MAGGAALAPLPIDPDVTHDVVLDRITEDVRTALANDPAATSAITVALRYPGLHAVWGHRVAHALWERG